MKNPSQFRESSPRAVFKRDYECLSGFGEITLRDNHNQGNNEKDFFRVHVYENSSFENAGTARLDIVQLAENGSFINTGTGGSDPLISADLVLRNRVELIVSFAEDAVQKAKYELTVWGGELRADAEAGFTASSLTGTLEGFGTIYGWNLDAATGVLTMSMIPEPSAFGMLAGAGALAFAAARGRRRRG